MKNYPLLSIVFTSFTMLGCNSENKPDSNPPWNNSYIQEFISVDKISVEAGENIYVDFTTKRVEVDPKTLSNKLSFHLSLKGEEMSADAPKASDSYKKYSEYITLLGDNDFTDREYRYYGVLDSKPYAIVDTLKSISITCDKDFSQEYPANSELNSLFTVFYDNYYEIVKNNYQNYTQKNAFYTSSMVKDFPYAFIGENLATIEFEQKPFIGRFLILYSEVLPDKKGAFTFKIIITKKNGDILESICSYLKK